MMLVDPAARLLRLLGLLQDRPHRSADELAEALDVTTRTIRRDITRLRSLGYPVDTSAGRPGYTLGVGGRLPPLLLDDDEAFAIVHGLRLAASTAVAGAEHSALAALRKLDEILPARVRERARALDVATVHVDTATQQPVSLDVLTLLASACHSSERVRFSYVDHERARSDRRVDPFQLVHTHQRWYLVARDCDRDDWRTFRVDRITDPERTGHTFQFDNPPDAANRVLEGLNLEIHAVIAEVLVDVEPDDARRRYRTFAVVVPTGDGRSILKIGADSTGQIARYIASMSCHWQVLTPDSVRDELRKHSTRIYELASTPRGRHRS